MRLVRLRRVSKRGEDGEMTPVNVDRVLWMHPWPGGGGTTLFFGNDRLFVRESMVEIELLRARPEGAICQGCARELRSWDTDALLCNDCRGSGHGEG